MPEIENIQEEDPKNESTKSEEMNENFSQEQTVEESQLKTTNHKLLAEFCGQTTNWDELRSITQYLYHCSNSGRFFACAPATRP